MRIAEHCGLPKSSTYHLLNCMRERNFVTYYPEQRAWSLGPSAFEIGSAYLRAEPLSWLGRPLLQEVAAATGTSAHLAVLHGSDVLYILKEDPPGRAPVLISRVGLRLPAHLTAVGQAILMRLPPWELRALLPARSTLVRRTGRGPTLVSELERQLAEARERGFALERDMTTVGVTCIAATVFAHDQRPIAGLGLSYLSGHHDESMNPKLAAQVGDAASRLSQTLGGGLLSGTDADRPPYAAGPPATVPAAASVGVGA